MSIYEIVKWFHAEQGALNNLLMRSLQEIKTSHGTFSFVILVGGGFAYGILHAIGPGHGKTIVTSYLLANESSLKRGLAITFLASLLQAFTAISIVTCFIYFLSETRAQTEIVASYLENASYGLVSSMGFVICIKGLISLINFKGKTIHAEPGCNHETCHPTEIKAENNRLFPTVLMIVSIGIRPCSGALMILFLSSAVGLFIPGIIATLAMAIGTFLSTSALAFLALKSKEKALIYLDDRAHILTLIKCWVRVLGGLTMMSVAALFFMAFSETSQRTLSDHPLFRSLQ